MKDSRFSQDYEIAKKLVEENEGEIVYASMLQRKMSIGYVYARSILDEMAREKLVHFDGEHYKINKSSVFHMGIKQVDEVKKFKAGLHLIIDRKHIIPTSFIMKMVNHLCLDGKEVVLIKNQFVSTHKMLALQNADISTAVFSEVAKAKMQAQFNREENKLRAYNLSEICVYNNDYSKILRIAKSAMEDNVKFIFFNHIQIFSGSDLKEFKDKGLEFSNIDALAKANDAMIVMALETHLPLTLEEQINVFKSRCNLNMSLDQYIFVEDNEEDFNLIVFEGEKMLKTNPMGIDSRHYRIREDWSM